MGIVEETPQNYGSEIIGYVEPWIADPGQSLDVKVSRESVPLSIHILSGWLCVH